MAATYAKFIARIFTYLRHDGDDPGVLRFVFEWRRIDGQTGVGKFFVTLGPVINEDCLVDKVKTELSNYLEVLYPGQRIKKFDVLVTGL